MTHKWKWRIIRQFNLLNYFREHLHELKHKGIFYVKHKPHTNLHDGYYESVEFVDYDKRTKEYTVHRVNHKDGEKSYIKGVKKNQIYLHAR